MSKEKLSEKIKLTKRQKEIVKLIKAGCSMVFQGNGWKLLSRSNEWHSVQDRTFQSLLDVGVMKYNNRDLEYQLTELGKTILI